MKIFSIGSALPVRFGHPGQRIAYARHMALSRYADVRTCTIDWQDREWDDRGYLRENDHFYAHARHPDPALTNLLRAIQAGKTDADTLQRGWVNKRRASRIAADIAAFDPDLVLCGDPMLAQLSADITPRNTALACLETGLASWTHLAAARQQNADHSRVYRCIADQMAQTDLSWPLPVEQEKSDLFHLKSGKLVVPATGQIWLDIRILNRLRSALSHPAASSIAPSDIVLIGFAPELTEGFESMDLQPRWTRLHTMIGIAQCLFMPLLTPDLMPFVDAALSVGTPVLINVLDGELYQLPPQPGLYAVPRAHMNASLIQLLTLDTIEPARAQGISASKIAEMATTAPDLAAFLNSFKTGCHVTAKAINGQAPLRRIPLIARPRVLYNPVTEMLLLQLDMPGWTGLEEVRLLSEDGTELTRIAPNANSQKQRRYLLEGGLITALAPLGGALRIALYRDVEELYAARIPVEDFETVNGGIAMLELEDGAIRGVFWHRADQAETHIGLNANGQPVALAADRPIPITDLGITAVPFRTPLPHALNTRLHLELTRTATGRFDSMAFPQKPFEDHVHRLGRTPRETPELAALKGIHSGKRGWIIGNGPSVRLEDLARIPKDDIVFCFNRFYLSYDDNPLREDYVVSADTLMIADFGQDMIEKSTGLPLFCIPPEQLLHLKGDFVALPPSSGSVPIFSLNPARSVAVGGSSVFVALQAAWHMGLRDIALYGMDYSFTAKLQRDPRYSFPVSYDEGNHFIKGYRDAKPWCPPTWRDISAGFLNARIAFETSGGRIRNATRGGRLELFPRVDFNTLCPPSPLAQTKAS